MCMNDLPVIDRFLKEMFFRFEINGDTFNCSTDVVTIGNETLRRFVICFSLEKKVGVNEYERKLTFLAKFTVAFGFTSQFRKKIFD